MLTLGAVRLLAAVLTLSSAVLAAPLAAPKTLSNAKRFQMGLPPKAPRRLYDPSRTRALLPRASVSPEDPVSVYISILDPVKRGVTTRYLASDDTGMLTVVDESDDKTIFTLPRTTAPTGDFGYELEGTLSDTPVFWGITGTTSKCVAPTNTRADNAGDRTWDYVTALTTSDGGEPIGSDTESSIWQIDGTPSAVSAYFYNETNSYPLYWFLDTSTSTPYLTTTLDPNGNVIEAISTEQVELQWELAAI